MCGAVQGFDEHHEYATLTGFLEHAAGLHTQELKSGEDRAAAVRPHPRLRLLADADAAS